MTEEACPLPVMHGLLQWTRCATGPRLRPVERFSTLLQECCPDHGRLDVIKVTGTNGKGSVCAMLEAALRAAGYTTGMFTSPHLETMTQRIRLNGANITPAGLEAYGAKLEPALRVLADRSGPDFVPTFFEVLLLAALAAFRDSRVEMAIVEAGIGGARDATAALFASVSALTSLGFDHEEKLGGTLGEIAREKAGIASPGSVLVLGPSIDRSLVRVITSVSAARQVRVASTDLTGLCVKDSTCRGHVVTVSLDDRPTTVRLPLPGRCQVENLATAVGILQNLKRLATHLLPAAVAGIEGTYWPGRLEYVSGIPAFLLDAAHNESGMGALIVHVKAHFSKDERGLVFGAAAHKAYDRYLPLLGELADDILVTDEFHAAEDSAVLTRKLLPYAHAQAWNGSVADMIEHLCGDPAAGRKLWIVTGSVFLVGRIRQALGSRGETVPNQTWSPNC